MYYTLYIYTLYVYINTHTCMCIYRRMLCLYIIYVMFIILNIFMNNVKYKNINIQMYVHANIFNIYTVCVCIYI